MQARDVAVAVSNSFSVAQYIDPNITVTSAAAVLMTPKAVKDMMSVIFVLTWCDVLGE